MSIEVIGEKALEKAARAMFLSVGGASEERVDEVAKFVAIMSAIVADTDSLGVIEKMKYHLIKDDVVGFLEFMRSLQHEVYDNLESYGKFSEFMERYVEGNELYIGVDIEELMAAGKEKPTKEVEKFVEKCIEKECDLREDLVAYLISTGLHIMACPACKFQADRALNSKDVNMRDLHTLGGVMYTAACLDEANYKGE